jgi:hypothetical protein
LALFASTAQSTDVRTLVARVGSSSNVSLRIGGNKVVRLRRGVYRIAVTDRTRKCNFHLTGPRGFDRRTGVKAMGTVVWKVTLTPGSYQYRCDRIALSEARIFLVN